MRVELSGGQWAEMAENLDHITNDERDDLAYTFAETEGSQLRKSKALNRLLVRLGVTAWSLDLPLPREDPSVLGRIKGIDGRELEKAAWPLKFSTDGVDFQTPGDDASPSSPSEPSGMHSNQGDLILASPSPTNGSSTAD